MQEKNRILWSLGIKTIQELETEHGILASGREELFGAIFGRDSLITSLKLLKVYKKTRDEYFLQLVRKILLNLAELQGTTVNIESGEEPGKCIHEYRPNNHEHLTRDPIRAWYLYPDNVLKNYDSVDSTPLFLIAMYQYWEISKDQDFLTIMLPRADSALRWMAAHGDINADGFFDYRFHPDRKSGGLVTQSWMDSAESVFHESGDPVAYPVAPLEVQAYAYMALRSWASFYGSTGDAGMASTLRQRAHDLKVLFNQKFIIEDDSGVWLAAGIDGNGKPLLLPRSSMGHCLWASIEIKEKNGSSRFDCILENSLVPAVVKRLLAKDLFVRTAGIRTLSSRSSRFEANSYHNGSIWPHDNSIIIEGLENFGYYGEAMLVRRSLLRAIQHFQSPVELYVSKGRKYVEYCSPAGQQACRKQAWCAASLLKELSYTFEPQQT